MMDISRKSESINSVRALFRNDKIEVRKYRNAIFGNDKSRNDIFLN